MAGTDSSVPGVYLYLPTYLIPTYLLFLLTYPGDVVLCASQSVAGSAPGVYLALAALLASARAADLVGGQAATSTQLVQTPVKTLEPKHFGLDALKVMRSDLHIANSCGLQIIVFVKSGRNGRSEARIRNLGGEIGEKYSAKRPDGRDPSISWSGLCLMPMDIK